MTTSNFTIGQNFKHYNGYIWTITEISGKTVKLESKNQTDNQVVKGSMTIKDFKSIINAGYYTQL